MTRSINSRILLIKVSSTTIKIAILVKDGFKKTKSKYKCLPYVNFKIIYVCIIIRLSQSLIKKKMSIKSLTFIFVLIYFV